MLASISYVIMKKLEEVMPNERICYIECSTMPLIKAFKYISLPRISCTVIMQRLMRFLLGKEYEYATEQLSGARWWSDYV